MPDETSFPNKTSIDYAKLEQSIHFLNDWLDFNFDNSTIPGMQVAIFHNDRIVYSQAFGVANMNTKEPLTAGHIFRVASHSKTFTATAIMQLVEQQRLNLEDRISEHLTWFVSTTDERMATITVRQLLNHVAGFPRDGIDASYWALQRDFPYEDELREMISGARLYFDQDVKLKYSNNGYAVLGMLIEQVSGLSYRDYMTNNIINRLDLQSTWPDYSPDIPAKMATGHGLQIYGKDARMFDHVECFDMSAAAGVCSTAEDMCRFFSAHFEGDERLLKDATKRQMHHGYWEMDDIKYGFGVMAFEIKGRKIIGHTGGFPGFRSSTMCDPTAKLVVSVIANTYHDTPVTNRKIIDIIDSFQKANETVVPESAPASMEGCTPLADFRHFSGRFFTLWGGIDIFVKGSGLFANESLYWNTLENMCELKHVGGSSFRLESSNVFDNEGDILTFDIGESGRAISFELAGTKYFIYEEAVKRGVLN